MTPIRTSDVLKSKFNYIIWSIVILYMNCIAMDWQLFFCVLLYKNFVFIYHNAFGDGLIVDVFYVDSWKWVFAGRHSSDSSSEPEGVALQGPTHPPKCGILLFALIFYLKLYKISLAYLGLFSFSYCASFLFFLIKKNTFFENYILWPSKWR